MFLSTLGLSRYGANPFLPFLKQAIDFPKKPYVMINCPSSIFRIWWPSLAVCMMEERLKNLKWIHLEKKGGRGSLNEKIESLYLLSIELKENVL